MIVTPAVVEKRLIDLSKEVDTAQKELDEAEAIYFQAKADYELELARARLMAKQTDIKLTVQEREDIALVTCSKQLKSLTAAEIVVRAARGNANRIRTQVDITRSIGTSVRSALDIQ